MTKRNEKTLVYVNTFAAHYAHDGLIKRYLDNKMGKHWIAMSDVLIPKGFDEDIVQDSFFHGIASAQYSLIQDGGIFINPLITGFRTDFNAWNGVVHEHPEFSQSVVYLDIPYGVYEVVNAGVDDVSEEEYNKNSKNMAALVDDLKDEFYVSTSVMH